MDLGPHHNKKWDFFIKTIKTEFNNCFILQFNPHSPYFEPIDEEIKDIDFPNEEIKQKCIKEDHVWILEYWRTSVSHICLGDYDLENLLKRFLDSDYLELPFNNE